MGISQREMVVGSSLFSSLLAKPNKLLLAKFLAKKLLSKMLSKKLLAELLLAKFIVELLANLPANSLASSLTSFAFPGTFEQAIDKPTVQCKSICS